MQRAHAEGDAWSDMRPSPPETRCHASWKGASVSEAMLVVVVVLVTAAS